MRSTPALSNPAVELQEGVVLMVVRQRWVSAIVCVQKFSRCFMRVPRRHQSSRMGIAVPTFSKSNRPYERIAVPIRDGVVIAHRRPKTRTWAPSDVREHYQPLSGKADAVCDLPAPRNADRRYGGQIRHTDAAKYPTLRIQSPQCAGLDHSSISESSTGHSAHDV